MSVSPVDALTASIHARTQFLEAQSAAGLPRDAVLTAQVSALTTTIRQTQGLTLADATALTNLTTAGPWTAMQKITLATAFSESAASQP
eukprot:6746908-Pyramimonas_sp.AAC.1